MLNFSQTRKHNFKVVADLPKQIRERLLANKDPELAGAEVARKTVVNYKKFTAERYQKLNS